MVEVVDVTVPGRPGARGEHAVSVAGRDGPPLPWRPGLGGVVDVEDVALAVEEHRDHGRVAQQTFGGFHGEPPAVAAQDEVVGVVDVAEAGQRAQVGVHVEPHGGAGGGGAGGPGGGGGGGCGGEEG